ncbi:aldolase/citrate lyase family protein [Ancylobacter sp. VNQ12]|uniref:aldolase/citrate lyase family protein n=1 Tax=Ancylobacter sp. VNQ12 TaxID=3400920 RepID=UPI003C0ACB98
MPATLSPPFLSPVPSGDGWLGYPLLLLFVPGTRPERFVTAVEAGVDAVIIDLEDAVATAEKAAARDAVEAGFPPMGRVFLRINPAGTPWPSDDLALAARLPLAGLVLPKAERCADIAAIGVVLGPDVPVVALIESALGLAEVRRIAAMSQVARLAFGSIDFDADIGSSHSREALLCARRGLAPAPDEIARAKRIVASLAAGGAVLAVDGAMVDAPVRLRAERVLARAGVPGHAVPAATARN